MNTKDRLRMLRKEHNLTQEQISNIIGIKESTYSTYETGRCDVNSDVLVKLTQYYGCSSDFILGVSDERTLSRVDEIKSLISCLDDNSLEKVAEFIQFILWKKSHNSE